MSHNRHLAPRPQGHVVLLGDSIFDNAAYVPGEPDVVHQLRTYLPPDWRATLLAIDGARLDDVHDQLRRLPGDATHLVLSAGGNDALDHIDIIDQRVSSTRETLERLHGIRETFALRYGRLLDAILKRDLRAAVCTIYEGNLEVDLQRPASSALAVFNDAILRSAFKARVAVIDLRLVCNTVDCYANPIEPSAIGGDRIARQIAELVTAADPARSRTVIFG